LTVRAGFLEPALIQLLTATGVGCYDARTESSLEFGVANS
jgi:hypothetical protein